MDANDNNSASVQIMDWRRSGGKPFSKQMITQFTDAYVRLLGKMS